MSETTVAPVEVKGTANRIDKGPYVLVYNSFNEGLKKGFGFWAPEYLNLNFAIAKFNGENPDPAQFPASENSKGVSLILGLLNTQLNSQLRNRATARFGVPAEDEQGNVSEQAKADFLKSKGNDLANGKAELVTQDEAETFVPGTREKSLVALVKEFSDLTKAGKLEEALEILEIIKVKQDEIKAQAESKLAAL